MLWTAEKQQLSFWMLCSVNISLLDFNRDYYHLPSPSSRSCPLHFWREVLGPTIFASEWCHWVNYWVSRPKVLETKWRQVHKSPHDVCHSSVNWLWLSQNVVLRVVTVRRTSFITVCIRDGYKSRFQSADTTMQPVFEDGFHFRRDAVLLPRLQPAAKSLHQTTRNFLVFLNIQHSLAVHSPRYGCGQYLQNYWTNTR